jgi:hypothetical protein
VLQGYSTLDIADHLVISVHTVQGHLRNIFTKTGVRPDVILLPRSSSPTTSRGSETTNSARQRICHCAAGRLLPPARVAAPARHRLSQQPGELSTAQWEDRFGADAGAEPTAAQGHRVAATHSRCACEANPDRDSTLEFGVATSGWCISRMP